MKLILSPTGQVLCPNLKPVLNQERIHDISGHLKGTNDKKGCKWAFKLGTWLPTYCNSQGHYVSLWGSLGRETGIWQKNEKAHCSNDHKWNSLQINICFWERMWRSVMEKSWEAWATKQTLIFYTGGKITISPLPPLIMSLNGKGITESTTGWKLAAYHQSPPPAPVPALLFYTGIYTYTPNWAN